MHDAKRIAKVQRYVDVAAAILLVRTRVSVDREFSSDDAAAEVESSGQGAHVYLGKGFFGMSREAQREVIAHELLHVHFDGMNAVMESMCQNVMGRVDLERMRALQLKEEHAIIDCLQRVCARLLPLPKF